jgi:hypothetical protein
MARTEYLTVQQIEDLSKKLKGMPPVAKTDQKKSKQEAVAILSDEIAGMKEKGYSLEMIADALKGGGLTLTVPTLKSYLQRAKQQVEGKEEPEKPPRKPRKAKAVLEQAALVESKSESSNEGEKESKRGPVVENHNIIDDINSGA